MWQQKNNSLYKKFVFKDFNEAIEFIKKVADLANKQNHHPKWTNNYNEVEIWLTSHDEGAVTDKDKRLAEAIDMLNSAAKNEQLSHAGGSLKLFTDGGSRGNPGPSALGYVLLDSDDNVVKKSSKYLGVVTNNQAEYMGLQAGLEAAVALGAEKLDVYMDSLLIVNQVKGVFKVKNAELYPMNQKVKELAGNFKAISFTHVPREMNKIADQLVNECLDQEL